VKNTTTSKLTAIKIAHTLIWLFFNVVFFYMLYAVIVNKIDTYVWIGMALFSLEIIVLIIFKNICPLTIIARRYSNSTKDNFDIYLPNWLAKNNKAIYTVFLLVFICLLIYRLLN
jgi:hypothetical protein